MSSSYRWTRACWFRLSFYFLCVCVFLSRSNLFVVGLHIGPSYFVFLCIIYSCLDVSTSAVNCLERPVPEVTCYVSSGTLNSTYSLTLTSCC